MKLNYRATMLACYNGYITQAICINLAPLFYLIFQRQYGLTLMHISFLIIFLFLVQLGIDLLATAFSKRMNIRFCILLAHLSTVVGLIGLSVFPEIMSPMVGLLLAEFCLGVGGGFIEVMVSPLIEACPTEGKSGNMSLLHSFYCWGQAGVVLLSGIFFYFFEPDSYWHLLPLFWAFFPLLGAIAFCAVPIYRLPDADRDEQKGAGIFSRPLFWCFFLMMFCAGASEMAMSQWASGFAESALGVSKSVGDLAGPCLFALMMGLARLLYGKLSDRISLERVLMIGCVLCVASYLLAAFSVLPVLAFLGCAICGFSVGVFWPGIISGANVKMPGGGIAMFAVLAVAGDIGCLVGPALSGMVADWFGGDLRAAFCFAVIFPTVNFIALLIQGSNEKKKGSL